MSDDGTYTVDRALDSEVIADAQSPRDPTLAEQVDGDAGSSSSGESADESTSCRLCIQLLMVLVL